MHFLNFKAFYCIFARLFKVFEGRTMFQQRQNDFFSWELAVFAEILLFNFCSVSENSARVNFLGILRHFMHVCRTLFDTMVPKWMPLSALL